MSLTQCLFSCLKFQKKELKILLKCLRRLVTLRIKCIRANNNKRYFLYFSQKPATTVRFFDRNDYYSLHGEDAHLAAKIVFKSTGQVKTMAPDDDQRVDYVCVSKGNFEILLRELLLVKNYRVEVYIKKGQSNDWTLEFKGSPGNLIQFENLLFNNTEMVVGSSIISVNMKQTGQQKVLFYSH